MAPAVRLDAAQVIVDLVIVDLVIVDQAGIVDLVIVDLAGIDQVERTVVRHRVPSGLGVPTPEHPSRLSRRNLTRHQPHHAHRGRSVNR